MLMQHPGILHDCLLVSLICLSELKTVKHIECVRPDIIRNKTTFRWHPRLADTQQRVI